MDFFDEKIKQLHDTILVYFHNKKEKTRKYFQKNITRIDSQISFEASFVEQKRKCSKATSKLSGLNKDVLLEKLENEFYSSNLMEEMRCIINLIVSPTGGKINEYERINYFFSETKQFGEVSSSGIALRSSLSSKKSKYNGDLIVIKCPQDPNDSYELTHEACVGLVLNNLRHKIPNFCYVYDSFNCSSPWINQETRKVLNWCITDKNVVNYVVYENINNSKPFKKWSQIPNKDKNIIEEIKYFSHWNPQILELIPEINAGDKQSILEFKNELKYNKTLEFLLYYLQFLFALDYANVAYDFTHYDCHDENILIRKYSDLILIQLFL